jgi:hypothetical protein
MTNLKTKTCAICKTKFAPFLSTTKVCSIECAIVHGKKKTEKQEKERAKIERAQVRKAKEAIKPRAKWLKEAQKLFNEYIKLRDANLPCISCGRYVLDTGGWDCGHFKTVGSSPHLRFVEDNAHKQCSSCNRGSEHYIKKRERVASAYEKNLRARIGDERVDAVKNDNEARHYTIDDIKQIKETYKQKVKDLENAKKIQS